MCRLTKARRSKITPSAPHHPSDAASKPARANEPGGRRGRERKCIATGAVLPEAELVRFAVGPDGVITPDVAAKLPGRGVWVGATRQNLELAAKKGGFARSLKGPVKVPEGLADQTETLLARRCLDHIGLMRRAGALASGFDQVEAAIRAGKAYILIEAADGAEDGREKLLKLFAGLWNRPAPVVGCYNAAELGMALGRDRVIHACVLQERMAQGWAAEIGRLSGFRSIVPGSWPFSRLIGRLGPSDADGGLAASAPHNETLDE